ncbi:TPA: DUF4263 domain-containing protein [Klebsiella pneumoniae]|nr:DUF4263 domain-containing protein [Klebsiella pneumoniae]
MSVTIEYVAEFIFAYIRKYREAYTKATTSPPRGPGYPAIVKSPFLNASSLDVYVAVDGVVLVQLGDKPYDWNIAGGPAFKIDYEPTRTPPYVSKILAAHDLLGKPIGIYRIVPESELPVTVWRGEVQGIEREEIQHDSSTGVSLNLREVRASLGDVVNALTFGAYWAILNVYLPTSDSPIGETHLTRGFGMFPADLSTRRFFEYLEIFGHSDSCAWDLRIVDLRVQRDLRRDLAQAMSNPDGNSGIISFGDIPPWIESYGSRLELLKSAIDDLKSALQQRDEDVEAVFHTLLERHPLLLDVYGTVESKPGFNYPDGVTSPIGKTKLQPDFIVRYPDQSYKLVEIERPAKAIATSQGQPRAEVSQAVFQTAEWKHFIKTHYQIIAERYPGIQAKCKTAVVMSRSRQENFKNIGDMRAYMGLMMEQFNIDEFLTFDDLLDRASTAFVQLSGLGGSIS